MWTIQKRKTGRFLQATSSPNKAYRRHWALESESESELALALVLESVLESEPELESELAWRWK